MTAELFRARGMGPRSLTMPRSNGVVATTKDTMTVIKIDLDEWVNVEPFSTASPGHLYPVLCISMLMICQKEMVPRALRISQELTFDGVDIQAV